MEKTVVIKLNCYDFPGIAFGGRKPIYVGVQKKKDTVDEVRGDTQQVTFTIPIQTKSGRDGNPDFRGPYVHGKIGDRFLYLVWFEKKESTNELFRRAKIKLNHLTWQQLQQDVIEAHLIMSDHEGCPVCATIPEGLIRWSTE